VVTFLPWKRELHGSKPASSIERDIAEIKIDGRSLRDRVERDFRITWAGIMALGLGLAGLMAKGFGWL
jgi:hypothetical protein